MRHLSVNTFALRLDDDNPDWPTVRVLVDGQDLASFSAELEGWQGFDPKDVLGPRSPWLPAESAYRTAVYRCSCGETGCGALSPLLAEDEHRLVSWSRFLWVPGEGTVRDLADSNLAHSHEIAVPRLAFDAALYRAEIARLSSSGWETPRRKTARLLWQRLLRRPELDALSIVSALAFMVPDSEDTYRLRLTTKDSGMVWLLLPAPAGTPEDRADAMVDALLSTPAGQWPYDEELTDLGGRRVND